ncbi:hypothetical protein PKOR_14495 [Pontibacter korlensis]|uniref:Uncharacterized protein n=1 Tax=Pontibacter korlensis TaxID=400092 RepID=A0A0E3UXB1_9BACT|nr:hypothetical protein [Pontibacter korlensis]AKD04082.1 hypothetical protein PKOR_14495 [Pontibacter korlensis]
MNLLNPLLAVKYEDRNALEIIGWWELRRPLYNVIVLVCGLISMSIMSLMVKLEPWEDIVEPIVVLGFAFLCNLGYTLGWISEIMNVKTKTFGPKLFKVGLYFTLFWVFLPALIHIILWISRGFERMQ